MKLIIFNKIIINISYNSNFSINHQHEKKIMTLYILKITI